VALGTVLKAKTLQGCNGAPSILSNDFLEEMFAETEIHRAKMRGPEGKTRRRFRPLMQA
jgi:hypothetical protein